MKRFFIFKRQVSVFLKYKALCVFFIVISALFGAGIEYLLLNGATLQGNNNSCNEKRENSGYKYINPLLECEVDLEGSGAAFKSLETQVKNYIDKTLSLGNLSEASFYYRDLNNGPWVGINEKEQFTPSSLLKLPIMMAFLKKAESDPQILQKVVLYNKSNAGELSPVYQLSKVLEDGKSYSLEDLLNRMIIYSDNDAKDLLLDNIDEKDVNKTYSDLGLILPPDKFSDDFMSVKEYSALIRVLFN